MIIITFLLEKLRFAFAREVFISEIGCGLGTLLWGLLALKTSPPAPLIEWPNLEFMADILGLNTWALWAMVAGSGQAIWCRFIDGRWRRPWARWICGLAGCWIWAAFIISSLQTNGPSPALAAFTTLCGMEIWVSCRILYARNPNLV